MQTEAVGDVQDGLRLVLELFLTVLGRWVAADVEALATNADFLAVGFVDGAVNQLDIVRVGDDLVAGDNVL